MDLEPYNKAQDPSLRGRREIVDTPIDMWTVQGCFNALNGSF